LSEICVQDEHLRVDNKYFALRDSNLSVTKFICISIAKSSVEWIIVRWEKSFDILHNNNLGHMYYNVGKMKPSNNIPCYISQWHGFVLWQLPLNKQSWTREVPFLSLPSVKGPNTQNNKSETSEIHLQGIKDKS